MPFTPTSEQEAIFQTARQKPSVLVRAYAGTGKTTTMEHLAHKLDPSIPGLALAFNKLIANELEKRFPKHFQIKTFNGLGHGAWSKAISKRLILDARKVGRLVSSLIKAERLDLSTDQWGQVKDLVTLAQTSGLVPKDFAHLKGLIPDKDEMWKDLADEAGCDENLIWLSQHVLMDSIKEAYAGIVSFDDQIYMSSLFGGQFPRFPIVIVDEAQDLSPLNHLMVQKVAADRLFVVGDAKQAIYAFRGADHTSMEKLQALRKEWLELPLFTTFRCPKKIVERASSHAPGYTAFETNKEGEIIDLPRPQTLEQKKLGEEPTWAWEEVEAIAAGREIAILCRNNAPLLGMAFKLLRRGVGVKMLGRDIGKSLVTLAKKIFKDQPQLPLPACIDAIHAWRSLELAKAEATRQDNKADSLNDRAEALLAIAQHGAPPDAQSFIEAISRLFARENGTVVLATGHKAKGLEWDVVLHLDSWRIPSKWAKSLATLSQENNLRYVIETRPKSTLILANLESFK
jgi:superfamily I DNA/RNA helicase